MDKVLVMVPTPMELELLQKFHQSFPAQVQLALCGFGISASGAVASMLVHQHQPTQVILVGIAGSLSDEVSIGRAYQFNSVSLFGVGAGETNHFQGPKQLDFEQVEIPGGEKIFDTLELESRQSNPLFDLLTVASCSSNRESAEQKRNYFPSAVAEDMESFSVAVACRLVNVPLTVVRGISNRAGDREKSNWQIEEAMRAAAESVQGLTSYRSD